MTCDQAWVFPISKKKIPFLHPASPSVTALTLSPISFSRLAAISSIPVGQASCHCPLLSLSLPPRPRIISLQSHQKPGCTQGWLVPVDRCLVILALQALLAPGFAAAAALAISSPGHPHPKPLLLYLRPLLGWGQGVSSQTSTWPTPHCQPLGTKIQWALGHLHVATASAPRHELILVPRHPPASLPGPHLRQQPHRPLSCLSQNQGAILGS